MSPTTDSRRAPGVPYTTPSAAAARSQLVDMEVERGDDGVWRYAGTGVAIPGARDVTLSERLRPRRVGRPDETPEAVLFSLSEIVADSRLNWALQAGTRLRGGDEDVFVVPWAVWEERSGEVVDVELPERDGDGMMRGLARVEREVRLARHRQDVAASERIRMLLFASRLGVTRRAAAGLLGISASRVQQLLDDASEESREEARELERDATRILEIAGSAEGVSEAEVASAVNLEAARLERVLHVLRLCDLIIDREGLLRLTDAGRKAARTLGAVDLERS